MKSNAAEIYFNILAEIACGASNEEIIEENPFHTNQDLESIRNSPPYKPEFIKVATRLCLLGLNNEAIANYFAIPIYILNCWRNAYPLFKKAISNGRENADCTVAEALLSICTGYSHPEEKVFKSKDDDIIIHSGVKHYPPNIGAIKLWLEARRSGIWKNPELIEIGMNLSIETKDMTKDELDKALDKAGLVSKTSQLSSLQEVEDAEFDEEEE